MEKNKKSFSKILKQTYRKKMYQKEPSFISVLDRFIVSFTRLGFFLFVFQILSHSRRFSHFFLQNVDFEDNHVEEYSIDFGRHVILGQKKHIKGKCSPDYKAYFVLFGLQSTSRTSIFTPIKGITKKAISKSCSLLSNSL